MASLTINGVPMPEPALNGLTITEEPIWSSNTGRSTSGRMIGDLIGWKTTLDIKWPPLTLEEMSTVERALRAKAFFTVTYKDTLEQKKVTKTFYTGSLPKPVYSYAKESYVDVTVKLVEQ